MEGKKVLLFGASGGIGQATAITIAKLGYQVIGLGRSQAALNKLKKDINALGEDSDVFTVDLASPRNTEEVTKKLLDMYESFDWIVQAAGSIDPEEPAHSQSLENISLTMRVNAESVLYTSERLLPFLTQGGGIIFISSTAGIWGNKDFPVYSASKGALNAYGIASARRLEDSGNCSIVIAPGPTNTPMRARIAADAAASQSPIYIANVITKIIDGTSEYRNGDIIIVRGEKETLHSRL